MSLKSDSGSLYIVDYDVDPPFIVFDSSEGLFHCTESGPIEGDITLSSRTARTIDGDITQQQNININNNYTLASVHADADIVLGGFKVTTSDTNNQGLNDLGVYDAGGTYVHVQEGSNNLTPPWAPNRSGAIIAIALYTFYAGGGLLRLNERVFLSCGANVNNTTLTRTLLSVRFDFKLYVGTLT